MPTGRFSAGVEGAFGHAFADEIQKIAAKGSKKKGDKKEKEKGRGGKDRLLKALVGAGVGGALGSGAVAGLHGVQHARRKALYRAMKPFVRGLGGSEAAKLFKKHFKPRFLRPGLYKGMAVGGLAGAVPGALAAAIT